MKTITYITMQLLVAMMASGQGCKIANAHRDACKVCSMCEQEPDDQIGVKNQ